MHAAHSLLGEEAISGAPMGTSPLPPPAAVMDLHSPRGVREARRMTPSTSSSDLVHLRTL
jgi:hypothetical protein